MAVGKNVVILTVIIECCGAKGSEVNEQCEVTSGIASGDSVLGRGLDIDELK